jgi:arylamine N-acetyltransferase
MIAEEISQVLNYLGIEAQPPSLEGIDELLGAYTRKVPWESISRIARKATSAHLEDAPLMPSNFWVSAIAYGTGGTCYESNYAFLTLLQALGYRGYLTINNMNDTIGCHSAIILTIEEKDYLVDVGMPFHVAIPIHPTQKTSRQGQFHAYSITPQGGDVYLIERDNHPKPYCYTLINKPISEPDYQKILVADYGDGGLFLDRGIIVKVIHDQVWRFDSSSKPFQIEIFLQSSTDKLYHFLGKEPQPVSLAMAQQFGISAEIVKVMLENIST